MRNFWLPGDANGGPNLVWTKDGKPVTPVVLMPGRILRMKDEAGNPHFKRDCKLTDMGKKKNLSPGRKRSLGGSEGTRWKGAGVAYYKIGYWSGGEIRK